MHNVAGRAALSWQSSPCFPYPVPRILHPALCIIHLAASAYFKGRHTLMQLDIGSLAKSGLGMFQGCVPLPFFSLSAPHILLQLIRNVNEKWWKSSNFEWHWVRLFYGIWWFKMHFWQTKERTFIRNSCMSLIGFQVCRSTFRNPLNIFVHCSLKRNRLLD